MSGFCGDQKCNADGRKIIESYESFSPVPYLCPSGIPTQGFGHTIGITMKSPPIDLAKADAWLQEDLDLVESILNDSIRYELSSNQFSALCSLTFNIGVGNFMRSSLLHVINAGDLDDAPAQIRLWTHDKHGNVLNGLVKRRESEVALWLSPDPESSEATDDAAIA